MKKLLLIASVMIVLSSCEEPNVEVKNTNYKIGPLGKGLQIIMLEDCEYYFASLDGGYVMCHKGNCINPIHYKNK